MNILLSNPYHRTILIFSYKYRIRQLRDCFQEMQSGSLMRIRRWARWSVSSLHWLIHVSPSVYVDPWCITVHAVHIAIGYTIQRHPHAGWWAVALAYQFLLAMPSLNSTIFYGCVTRRRSEPRSLCTFYNIRTFNINLQMALYGLRIPHCRPIHCKHQFDWRLVNSNAQWHITHASNPTHWASCCKSIYIYIYIYIYIGYTANIPILFFVCYSML